VDVAGEVATRPGGGGGKCPWSSAFVLKNGSRLTLVEAVRGAGSGTGAGL